MNDSLKKPFSILPKTPCPVVHILYILINQQNSLITKMRETYHTHQQAQTRCARAKYYEIIFQHEIKIKTFWQNLDACD